MTNQEPTTPDYTAAVVKARAEFLASCPAKEEQPKSTTTPYPLVSVATVLKCPPLRWRVKGLIPARGIGQIYGASTAGKSFLSLDLAIHVARGTIWYDHKTKSAPVTIFSLEGQEGTRNRLAAYIAYHGEELPPNLSIGTAPTTFYKPEDLEAIAVSLPDAMSAWQLSKKLDMPFEMTLENLAAARLSGSEIVPEDIKDFAPAFLRLAQYDYDSVLFWQHDLATANAVAAAFDKLDSNRVGGLSGGLRYAGEKRTLPDDPNSRLTATAHGLEKGGLSLAQGALTVGKAALEGLGKAEGLGQYIAEGIASAVKSDALPVGKPETVTPAVEQWHGDLVQMATKAMGEVSVDAPYAGKTVWDDPEVLADSRWWLENGISTAMSSLPAIAAYVTGGKLAATGAGFAMEASSMYNELIADGMPDGPVPRGWSTVYGLVAGVLDATGTEAIFGGMPAVKKKFKGMMGEAVKGGFKNTAKYGSARVGMGFFGEGPTEWLQGVAQAGFEGIAKDKPVGEIMSDMGEAAKQLESFILGGALGGVMSGVHARGEVRGERLRADIMESLKRASNTPEMVAARKEIEDISREGVAAQSRMAFAQSLEKAVAAADSSSLHAADPALFEQESAKLIPEEAREVWLDVETVQDFINGKLQTFNQTENTEQATEEAGPEQAAQRLEALGLTQQDIDSAVATQAQGVKVSTMRLVSRFSGAERKALLEAVRSEPGGMTLSEAKSFDPVARSEEAAARIRSASQTGAEVNKERTRLKQEFVQAG